MKEYWINVYNHNNKIVLGFPLPTLKAAIIIAGPSLIYRIHVRMK